MSKKQKQVDSPDVPSTNSSHLITFTDLIYAALISYGLFILQSSIDMPIVNLGFATFAIMLLCYDWYGEHFLSIQVKVGGLLLFFDFISLFSYFFLLWASVNNSLFYSFVLVIRALRGLAVNVLILPKHEDILLRSKIKSYNVSSGLMIFAYASVFVYDNVGFLAPNERLLWCVGIWVAAYVASFVFEAVFAKAAWTNAAYGFAVSITSGIARLSKGASRTVSQSANVAISSIRRTKEGLLVGLTQTCDRFRAVFVKDK